MNCKQGDLAIVVKSNAGNEGKIVRCLEYIGVHRTHCRDGSVVLSDWWRIDIELCDFVGFSSKEIEDEVLRPIRPSDEPDETLAWLDVPSEVTA